jgi:hypothetical protein
MGMCQQVNLLLWSVSPLGGPVMLHLLPTAALLAAHSSAVATAASVDADVRTA